MAGILKKNQGLSVKNRFFWTFSPKPVIKVSIFCIVVESNRAHLVSMVLYLGKILIRDYLGD